MSAPSSKHIQPADQQILQGLLPVTHAFVKDYMSSFDGSHDFSHVQRVLNLALTLANREEQRLQAATGSVYDRTIISLAALLHDVGDKKYTPADNSAAASERPVYDFLLKNKVSEELSTVVQKVVDHVSYSHEIKNEEGVIKVVAELPELAIVQDADRLDAIGAVGIGRTFTYSGAKKREGEGMENVILHFENKLLRLQGRFKTECGRQEGTIRTKRLIEFERWWYEEKRLAGELIMSENDPYENDDGEEE